jgi:hypothetical protein
MLLIRLVSNHFSRRTRPDPVRNWHSPSSYTLARGTPMQDVRGSEPGFMGEM